MPSASVSVISNDETPLDGSFEVSGDRGSLDGPFEDVARGVSDHIEPPLPDHIQPPARPSANGGTTGLWFDEVSYS